MEELDKYKDLATDDMKKAVKDAGKTVKNEISANAPKKTGKYAKSWRNKTTKETADGIQVTVHSPSRYQIAHLLENGHAKRNGGRVRAIPHIKPAEENEWLDQFEMFSIYEILPEILELWGKNLITTVNAPKNFAAPQGK